MSNEMKTLRKWLDANRIDWTDGTSYQGKMTIWRTYLFIKGTLVSVIYGFNTYGVRFGLLEM